MNKASVGLLLLISVVFSFGLRDQGEWIKYNSPEGRFKILFPREPRISTPDTTGPTGERIQQHIAVSLDSSGDTYMVGYFDIAPEMKYSFHEAQEGMIAAAQGTLLSERKISLGEYPGHEFKASFKRSNGNAYTVQVRFFQVGTRIYVIQVVAAKASAAAMESKKSAAYFDSFELTTPR